MKPAGWALLVVTVTVLIVVVQSWVGYSRENEGFLNENRAEKRKLTYEDFLNALHGLPLEWDIITVFGHKCIRSRSAPSKGFPWQFSPLTAVCRVHANKPYFVHDWPARSWEALGLPPDIGEKIYRAEDGLDLAQPEIKRIRHDLLQAVGLPQSPPSA